MRAPRAPVVGRIGDMASGAIPIRGRGGAPGLVYARRVASWMRGSLVFVGYGAAVTAAAALAGIRSRATPTASVAASPGMFASGDLLWLLFTPISLVVFLATWRTSAEPDTRRRALRALALEAGGLVGLAAWLGRAVLSRA